MPTLNRDRQFLDKWEMHQALSTVDIGPCKLPDTAFATPEAIMDFLERYPVVYIKPVGGWGGRSIARVEARKGQYHWQQQGFSRMTLQTPQDVVQRFVEAFGGEAAIVQQAAPLRTVNGRLFDVRALLQRNESDEWVHAGNVARIAGRGAVVSNVAISRGEVWAHARLFQKLQVRPNIRRRILGDIEVVALKVAKVLDGYRDFEEIGLDFGLDFENLLWLIEVNTNDNLGGPSHELFAQLLDKSLYKAIQARTEMRQMQLLSDIWGELSQ
jgi:hypothetical protein